MKQSWGAKVFSIVNATGTNYDALRTLFPDMQSWPVPRAVLRMRRERIFTSWNQLDEWLRQLDGMRLA
jgi:hypothetical protein